MSLHGIILEKHCFEIEQNLYLKLLNWVAVLRSDSEVFKFMFSVLRSEMRLWTLIYRAVIHLGTSI